MLKPHQGFFYHILQYIHPIYLDFRAGPDTMSVGPYCLLRFYILGT
uniref:Uncharacterized protein n=1 Tax=Anguilla anguilla TaxID=7936 RepID=A0A0E9X8U8_ANGAN